jgi:hypothetical protein
VTETETGPCGYVHSTEEGEWECPHPVPDGGSACPFHADPGETTTGAVREAFLDAVRGPPERWEFLGATVPTLDLRHVLVDLDNRETVDLRDATVEGDLLLDYVTVRQPLDLSGATVEGDVRGYNFDVESEFTCRSLDCGGTLDFHEATFSKNVTFDGTTVGEDARFEFAAFHGAASFDGLTVTGTTTFREATFRRTASFDGVRFGRRADLSADRFSVLELAPDRQPDDGLVPLVGCEVDRGRVLMGETDVPLYDCTDTVLGDVHFDGPDRVFGHLRLRRTEYDGFDFGAHRQEFLEVNYRIHEEVGGRVATDGGVERLGRGEVERLYENASVGAREGGYPELARQFKVYRRLFERRRHFEEFTTAERPLERVDASNRWLLNVVESLITGYGERPWRALFSSFSILLMYGVLYQAVAAVESLGAGVRTSAEVMLAFLLGMPDAYEVAEPAVRLVMQTQAVVGFVVIGVVFVSMVTDRVT